MGSAVDDRDGSVLSFANAPPYVRIAQARQLYSFSNWGAADQLIRLPDVLQAYQNKGVTLNGAGQTIAVIDSGIDHSLPQLGAGLWPGTQDYRRVRFR